MNSANRKLPPIPDAYFPRPSVQTRASTSPSGVHSRCFFATHTSQSSLSWMWGESGRSLPLRSRLLAKCFACSAGTHAVSFATICWSISSDSIENNKCWSKLRETFGVYRLSSPTHIPDHCSKVWECDFDSHDYANSCWMWHHQFKDEKHIQKLARCSGEGLDCL